MDSIKLTEKQAQELGFKSSIQVGKDIGFTDFKRSSASALNSTFVDLENLGKLKMSNPRVVVRDPVNYINTETAEINVWKSWRQVVEKEFYYAKYKIKTRLIGQVGEAHFPLDFFSYKANNFFKPWSETKIVKRVQDNNFSYGRFRFPKYASNTLDIRIQTRSGEQLLSPKFVGKISQEEERKTYYRWHPQATRFASGQQQSQYDNLNLSGFNIPYPSTLSVYDSAVFNIPLKIAPKFNQDNSQSINGLLVISTGDAEQKTICYVSPHTITTGYLNTIEDIYVEELKLSPTNTPGSNTLMTVEGASWYGSGISGYIGCSEFGYLDNLNGAYKEAAIPSTNSRYKRFYKINEPTKQVYFDNSIATPYGSGSWVISISGNSNLKINTGQKGVVYIHQPNSVTDWKKKDPRKLNGPWAVASGHSLAASAQNLNKAAFSKPRLSKFKNCRKDRRMLSKRLNMPSLIVDSKYLNDGYVLPEGVKYITEVGKTPIYSQWRTISTITGDPIWGGDQKIYYPSGNDYSGYVINGQPVTMTDIIASGINIPMEDFTGLGIGITSSGHFQQSTPLKDTYFYKFYNQLYKNNNKTIATGTWNGIIPSGVRFSIELVSVTLNDYVGISNDNNIAVLYSGYKTNDYIDSVLCSAINKEGAHFIFPNPSEKYQISGQVGWIQKRNPYRHTFDQDNNLVYTSHKAGPTLENAKDIARIHAIKQINSKILQIINKVLPNLTYKNKKWKRMRAFKEKLQWLKGADFSYISIPETAEPGAVVRKRLKPYSESSNTIHVLAQNYQQ